MGNFPMNAMQGSVPITLEVRINRLLHGDSAVKAFASVTLGGAFAAHGIRIIEKDDHLFVSMPSRSYKAGDETKYSDLFHPVSSDARAMLTKVVLEAYKTVQNQKENTDGQSDTN